jgi:hypothetical protein
VIESPSGMIRVWAWAECAVAIQNGMSRARLVKIRATTVCLRTDIVILPNGIGFDTIEDEGAAEITSL